VTILRKLGLHLLLPKRGVGERRRCLVEKDEDEATEAIVLQFSLSALSSKMKVVIMDKGLWPSTHN